MDMTEPTVLLAEDILDFVNALEAACVRLRMQIDKNIGPIATGFIVLEETFTGLRFEPQEGARLGAFELATEKNNPVDKWRYACSILKNANATIQSRYSGEGYAYSYWLYGEGRIYRQKLKG